jgi:hypothetical protein
LFTFGNGGSATDAEGTAELFRDPPRGRPLPAISLVDDRAVITALANDVGFELVFSRQLIAHARAGDIAIGFSTSGDSVNVVRPRGSSAPGAHDRPGGHAGGDGRERRVEHCFVVRSASVASKRLRTRSSSNCGRSCSRGSDGARRERHRLDRREAAVSNASRRSGAASPCSTRW